MTNEYDLVVIGGGIGGYVSAIRASQLGMKVALVENQKLGGTCLHHGCIPTKSLLRTAEMYRQMNDSFQFGIEVSNITLQFEQAQKRKNKVVQHLYQGVKSLLTKANIDVYDGFGRLLGPSIFSPLPGTVSVEHKDGKENTILIPKYVLIATGSRPKTVPNIPIDGVYILTSTQALQLEKLPKSILIVGGGVIGIEWASMLQDLGVRVTVIENSEQILSGEDHEIRKEVQKQLYKRGIRFLTKVELQPETLKLNESSLSITVKHDGETNVLEAEKMLVSVGRVANIEQIGLHNTSIETKNDFIVTNEMYQTKESHIYAIGDCIGGMQLAHVASTEGIVAVEHMAGKKPAPINPNHIPTCIYSYPEVAKVGLTEQIATEQGYSIKVGKFPFKAIGKAHIYGDPNGFAKLIIDEETDDILGVHMVGPNVTDMISEAGLATVLDASAWEISKTIHPHPTLSEIFPETALSVEQLQIHG